MAHILVTGFGGFAGRHLAPALLAAGHQVRATQRKAASTNLGGQEGLDVRAVDDLATANLDGVMEGVDAVVHLAGLAHISPTGAADRFFNDNVRATQAVTRAAQKAGVSTFINLSSVAAICGKTSDQIIDDQTSPAPVNDYGKSKLEAEAAVESLAALDGVGISLRAPMVIGADARGNWAKLQKIAATGLPLPIASIQAKRSFISIQSLVEAIVHLCSRQWPATLSGSYCIADAEPLSLPEVVTELRRGMGRPPRLFPCPVPVLGAIAKFGGQDQRYAALTGPLVVDASRFGRTFGFLPTIGVRQAIAVSGKAFVG